MRPDHRGEDPHRPVAGATGVVVAGSGESRADDDVGSLNFGDQLRDVSRVVLSVCIDLYDRRVAVGQRVSEARAAARFRRRRD